jgi:cleavage and polyadenylation specificity factor subunit 3
MMATPSGLQSGVSRDVFEAWCEDAKNQVIICDFAVQGTLAREILAGPTHVLSKTGVRKPLRAQVDHISFSAHADFEQTSGFLDATRPAHVVLVHGEVTEMGRLKGALERSAQAQNIPRNVFMPRNSQAVQIEHKPLRAVRVVGRLAQKAPMEGVQLRGVLVAPLGAPSGASSAAPADGGSFVVSTAGAELMHPDDLPQFSKLYKGTVTQRQALATGDKPFTELRLALEVMFEGVEGAGTIPVSGASSPCPSGGASRGPTPEPEETPHGPEELAVRVGDVVTVSYRAAASEPGLGGEAHVVLEWAGGRVGDAVADAVAAVLLQVGTTCDCV